jgi:enediyne biosynthesis protein E4
LVSRRSLLRHLSQVAGAWCIRGVGGTRSPGSLAGPFRFDAPSNPFVLGSSFDVTLVDIAAQAGLNAICVCGEKDRKHWIIETTGCGVAFLDYDNDGWLDIFTVNATTLEGFPKGSEPTNHLYHNNRNGTFTDVTARAGLWRTGWGQGVCIGDYDNDGFEDLFVTYWGQNVLYHNNANGTFTDVTKQAGLLQAQDRPRWSTGCSFIDYDRDGNLDLIVANYVDLDLAHTPAAGSGEFCRWKGIPVMCGPRGLPAGTNLLYRNNGNGTFTDVSEKSGISKPRGHYAFTTLTGDFDNDGWPDIYLACDSTPSVLYHNNHDGTFTDIATKAGCALNQDGLVQAGMGATAGDYDRDGWFDIFKTDFSDDTSTLYHNNADGTFSDVTLDAGMGINTRYLGWGCGFVDLDNDGWLDIFLANGHVYPEIEKAGLDTPFREPKIVYRNLRNGRFEDVSKVAGTGVLMARSSRGVAFGDFDNDGDVDILINDMDDPPTLLRADLRNGYHCLKVRTLGTRSNRSGIGARVRVTSGEHSQSDEVRSGGSYLSQNDLRLHFGMGSATRADQVEIRWPNGHIDLLRDVEADQLIWVREGVGIVNKLRLPTKG